VCTYQEITPEANAVMSPVASHLSRVEGMEGHARACDWRLTKYHPKKSYDFEVYRHNVKKGLKK
jgi:sulfopropanediol 3-dehydrogenase